MIDLNKLTAIVGDLEEDAMISMLNDFVASNPSAAQGQEVINACQAGMGIVGERFEKSEYFVGDLIFAGELLTEAVEILKPVIGGDNSKTIGTIVLGTVLGDLHDIGKNIFKSMAEAAGFKVYDLGIDVPPSAFVEKVKEVKPEIVGMSGLLTIAIDSMKDTIEALKAAGLRDKVKITIGGNIATKEISEYVGSDGYSDNASIGVKICKSFVGA